MKIIVFVSVYLVLAGSRLEAQIYVDSMKTLVDADIALGHGDVVARQNACFQSTGHYEFDFREEKFALGVYPYTQEFHEYPGGWIGIYRFTLRDTTCIRQKCYAGTATYRDQSWIAVDSSAAPALPLLK